MHCKNSSISSCFSGLSNKLHEAGPWSWGAWAATIHSSRQGSDPFFHFQRKDGQRQGAVAENMLAEQFVVSDHSLFINELQDLFFVIGEGGVGEGGIWDWLSLKKCRLCPDWWYGPSHFLDQLPGIGEQAGLAVPDELIAAGAFMIAVPAGKGKKFFLIAQRVFRCQHASSLAGRLRDNDRVAHRGDDPV